MVTRTIVFNGARGNPLSAQATRSKQLGGMMTTPKGSPMPPAWLYYVETKGLDDAIARATKRGAKVMNGPMDVPGGGRIAQLMDPQGAGFALHHYLGKP